VVGVIHDPTRNETFSAVLGRGAFRNGLPVQTSGETEMQSAMAIASLPVATDPENPAVRRFLQALSKTANGSTNRLSGAESGLRRLRPN
jgi:myo-inositol-1(or 4)-monophosphatase